MIQDTSRSVHFSCFKLTLHSCSNFESPCQSHISDIMWLNTALWLVRTLQWVQQTALWPCPRPLPDYETSSYEDSSSWWWQILKANELPSVLNGVWSHTTRAAGGSLIPRPLFFMRKRIWWLLSDFLVVLSQQSIQWNSAMSSKCAHKPLK